MTRPDERLAAKEFDSWADAGRAESMAEGHRGALLQAIEAWDFQPSHKVADIGCGNGWVCREMVERGAGSALGIDISPKMIERAKRLSDDDKRFEFVVGSAANIPTETASLHRITSVEALYYVPNPEDALREWARVCAPDGRLSIVIDLFKENPATHGWLDALDVQAHLLGAQELVDMAKRVGFSSASWRTVQDPRPIKSKSEFTPSLYWPSYEMYLSYRQCGSLIVEAIR